MQATQSSINPSHKVQRLSRDNQDTHPRGLVRAWVIFCDAPECPNYQIVDYIPKGEVGRFPQAVLDAALKGWDILSDAGLCYCPTHKGYVYTLQEDTQDIFGPATLEDNTELDYTSVGSAQQSQEDIHNIRRFREANADAPEQ